MKTPPFSFKKNTCNKKLVIIQKAESERIKHALQCILSDMANTCQYCSCHIHMTE